jgi:outer membrane receptor protein involved in Fe transport
MRQTMQRVVFALLAGVIALSAFAQASTATIRGKVTNERGNALGAAEINAVSTSSGYVHTVHSAADGTYLLAGLTPGEYNLVVAAPAYEAKSETVTVRVGQAIDLNLVLSPTAVVNESITVVGNQLIDTKATEIGTNITPQQIEALPQFDRNFLNFAAMAPGVQMSTNPERKVISAHGLDPEQTNVFIDGVSYKNDILLGGVAGGDSSRGNPFPQNAVQEFRVLTQNYSAQYDHASSAIITAVTKSGSNELNGDAFLFYEPKGWISTAPKGFPFNTLTTNPDYRRYQAGLSFGGPIVKDKIHFFASYEGVDEHAVTTVAPGTPPPGSSFNPAPFAGTFSSPFRGNLAFGKADWQPMPSQLLDFSGTYRHERDIRGFGGQTAFEAGENIRNYVYDLTGRDQWTGGNTFNIASLSWQKYGWNPTSLDSTTIGQNFFGVLRIGGRDTTQDFTQRRIELRDDLTTSAFNFGGQHTLQVGGNADLMHYDVTKCQDCNPIFNYRQDLGFTVPFEAFYGFGNPTLRSKNNEYGIYGQDSWVVNKNLNLNLGVRWDYESNMIDTGFVTPAALVAGLTGKVSSDYFSNGNQRSPYKGAIQPRLGFAYDIFADSRSVIFGGAGRYYDRLFFNAGLDERFRGQFPVYHFFFSPTGADFEGHPTIKWDPSYLSLTGLNALIAKGSAHPDTFLLNNDTKPPYSNQMNIGFRQTVGTWTGSASYNIVRGYRGFTWTWAGGHCCLSAGGIYGPTLLSSSTKRFWDDDVYLTLDRPYTTQARWGAHVAYTHSDATQTGNDLFSLDYPTPADYPRHTVPGTIKNRIVATGIFGLPFDIRLSGIVTLGSGAATAAHDFAHNKLFITTVYPKKSNGFAQRNVDLRLDKSLPISHGTSVGVIAEAFNIFNTFEGGCLEVNTSAPNFGQASCVVNLARRYQLGLKVGF